MPVVAWRYSEEYGNGCIRPEKNRISTCAKYILFVFNVFVWLFGLGILAVGMWSWKEKERFNHLTKASQLLLDPAFILIVIGCFVFIIGFTGCVGALRQNACLISTYVLILAGLLTLEMCAGFLIYIFRDFIKEQTKDGFQAFIVHYREDPDQQNLVDWIQEEWLQCCGVEGPKDWDRNNYFNCSSQDIGSREACGVPFSCCRKKPDEVVKNKQCGYDVRKTGFNFDVSKVVNEKGCSYAFEDWIESNLLYITLTMILVTFPKVLALLLCYSMRADMIDHVPKWQ